MKYSTAIVACLVGSAAAFLPPSAPRTNQYSTTDSPHVQLFAEEEPSSSSSISRRDWLSTGVLITAGAFTAAQTTGGVEPAQAVGPTKINLLNPTYRARPCPRDKPIPGEKAMKGMKGLCVTVDVDLEESPDKDLELVGVYGFVTDRASGESVLANNPDLSTDAGTFLFFISM